MRKSNSIRQWIICLAVFLMFGGPLVFGQVQTGGIQGTVTDTSGAAVPNAAVTITDVDTSSVRQVTADGAGRFSATSLMIGNYQVQTQATGFSPQTQKGLVLAVGQTLAVDFKLEVGTVAQEVTVQTTAASQVNTTTSEVGALVGQQQLEQLPLNGRNSMSLVALVPGVQPIQSAPSGGANFGNAQRYSIAGSRIDSGSVLLDGLEIRGFWGAQAGLNITGTSLGVESIAEFQTLTSGFNAEYNGVSVLNEVTRSGTNSFHGSAYGFFRNSVTDARNYFDPLSGPASFHRNQFGGALGGPIQKDKTFFFANYEGIRASLGLRNSETVPDVNAHNGMLPCSATSKNATTGLYNIAACNALGAAANPTTTLVPVTVDTANIGPYLALYPNYGAPGGPALPAGYTPNVGLGTATFTVTGEQPQTEDFFALKLDHQLTSKNNISFRWVVDRGTQTDPWVGAGTVAAPGLVPLANVEKDPEANWYGTLQDRHIFSANLINIGTFGYVRTNQQQNINLANVPDLMKAFAPQSAIGSIVIGGVANLGYSGTVYQPLQQIQNIFTEQDEVDWTHGAHSFKFGGGISRIQCACVQASNPGGQFTFGGGLQTFLANTPTLYQGPIQEVPGLTLGQASIRYGRQTNFDGFIQDDWRITKRITINLGLRDDFITNPVEKKNNWYEITNLDPFTCSNNIACDGGTPEAGVSTSATGMGGFSNVSHFFKDNPSTRNIDPRIGVAWDVFGNGKTSFHGGFGVFHSLLYPRFYTPGSGFNYPNGTTNVSQSQFNVNGVGTFPHVNSSTVVPQSRTIPSYKTSVTPYMQEWNATIEQQIPAGLKLTVSYVGSKGTHLYEQQDYNTNIPVPGTQFRPFSTSLAAANGCDVSTNCAQGYNANNDGAGLTPNTSFSSVQFFTAEGDSNYNSGIVSIQRSLGKGITFFSGFTWSRCLDYGSVTTGGPDLANDSTLYVYPLPGKKYNYGPCAFNITKNWTSNALIPLPFHGNQAKEGWQVAIIQSARTGNPVTPNLNTTYDRGNLGNNVFDTQRPDVNPNYTGTFYERKKTAKFNQWFDPNRYQLAAFGTFGNAPRESIIGPNLVDVDLSLVKDTKLSKLREGAGLEIRADFFNVANHTNFGLPNSTIFNGSLASLSAKGSSSFNGPAGQSTVTTTAARQMQFSAKLTF